MITVIGVTGFTGRMGRAVAEVVQSHPRACLGGGLARPETIPARKEDGSFVVTSDPMALFPKCDVIIDFSHARVVAEYASLAAALHKPFLSGTTGLDETAMMALRDAGKSAPVLYAPNTSLSLVVTKTLVALAARLLKDHDYDVSIVDKHHRWKRDAPSGTALSLGEAVTLGYEGKKVPTYASVRAGSIVGEHDILFAGEGETISVSHAVTDRRIFARGAVHAALWLRAQKPGFYSMDDVLTMP